MDRAQATLAVQVLKQVKNHPELHDQSIWGDEEPCNTPACLAGWTVRYGIPNPDERSSRPGIDATELLGLYENPFWTQEKATHRWHYNFFPYWVGFHYKLAESEAIGMLVDEINHAGHGDLIPTDWENA